MSAIVRYVLLAEAFAVTTYALGWWTVPIVAAAWVLFSTDMNRVRNAGLAAAGGWASLLLLDVARGDVGAMGSQLAGVMRLPAVLLYVITLVFPAILAWCAGVIVRRPAASPDVRDPSAASS